MKNVYYYYYLNISSLCRQLDDDSESSPNKGSGSERGRGSSPPTDPLVMQKLKKLRLDEK